jgi:hypothetical protein
MRESRGQLANIVMLALLGSLFVMALIGWNYGRRVNQREEEQAAKIPNVSEMRAEITTQFKALSGPVADASSELAATVARNTVFEVPKLLAKVREVGKKVEALAAADDGVFGAIKGLEQQLGTLDAVAGEPKWLLNVLKKLPFASVSEGKGEIPDAATRADLRREVARLTAAYHEAGANVEAQVAAGLDHIDRQMARLDKMGTRDMTNRRVYKKAHGIWDPKNKGVRTTVEKKLNEVRDRHPGYFAPKRFSMLLPFVLLSAAILYYIGRGRAGETLKIRRIAGLNALDEAVGRATEMGKPVLFVTGIMDLDDIQTLAGLNILGHVARKTAEYESNLQVPSLWPMTMSAAQEIVREAYLRAGKPDNYRSDSIYYLSSDQFAFAAGASGIMQREKPATVFYMGSFYAESLLMAEVGNLIGAIQIAGTAQQTQLPFFVAACDYTLIGEEMFAASAYLSNEPMLLGSLKGQDAGKVVMMVAIVAGGAIELLIAAGLLPVSMSLIKFFIIS